MDLIVKNNHLKELSTTLAKSSLVPAAFRGKPVDAFLAILMGDELGLSPIQSLNSIVVIQGKPTLSAQLMLGLCRKVQGFSLSIEQGEDYVVAKGKRGEDTFDSKWDIEKAKAMGLTSKDNYRKQLVTMLRWRAVSEVCRILCPDVLLGVYATEEFLDSDGDHDVVKIQPEPNDVELFHIERAKEHPEKYEVGNPEYEVANGKFRGKQLKEINTDELLEYYDTLEARFRDNKAKPWEVELMNSIRIFIGE